MHCYRQVASIFTFISDYFIKLRFLKCLRAIKTRKLHVRIVVPKLQGLILRVKREDVQLEHCFIPIVPISPKSQNDLNYQIAMKNSAPKLDVTLKCKLRYQEFPGFYALRQQRNTQHGMQIGSATRDVDVEHIMGDVEDHRLREKLRPCQHFLVDSELERERHRVFNYAVKTLNETVVNKKLDHFFKQFKMCSKSESGFWFQFEKHGRRRVQIILRARKQYPAGSIPNCVHP